MKSLLVPSGSSSGMDPRRRHWGTCLCLLGILPGATTNPLGWGSIHAPRWACQQILDFFWEGKLVIWVSLGAGGGRGNGERILGFSIQFGAILDPSFPGFPWMWLLSSLPPEAALELFLNPALPEKPQSHSQHPWMREFQGQDFSPVLSLPCPGTASGAPGWSGSHGIGFGRDLFS